MSEYVLVSANEPFESPARVESATRRPLRVGAVQQRFHSDAEQHRATLAKGVELAANSGAELVCLQELTLSLYFAIDPDGFAAAQELAESIPDGPTCTFVRDLALRHEIYLHASLYEKANDQDDARGFNTAICFSPAGELIARTRKLHIPRTTGYHEDRYFREGDTGFPLAQVEDAAVGFPTCWDQWFPELARAYSLAGADVLVYPTAIGSEPDHPGFDTEPLWEKVIVANGIMNGTFMVAINRIGIEGEITFYGSSFISDPYGRVLVQAPRYEPAVLVADLDLDQRRDWLNLFPFFETRRGDIY